MGENAHRLEHPGSTLNRGDTVDRFVIVGLVGRGGMGEVYAAYDPELDRKVAVKLLRTREGFAPESSDARTRLLREAQAIARLSHPNVVVVYDVGTHGASVFIAMEFIEGNTVGYWMQASKRSVREVLAVFLAAGRALAAAHEAGLIHRDFKPDNVMLTRDGQVRVMDFGLARSILGGDDDPAPVSGECHLPIAAPLPDQDMLGTKDLAAAQAAAASVGSSSGKYLQAKLTQTGALMGTPAYMAPEQFVGGQTDPRTDQFSFCVALYEALYGQRPFVGGNIADLMGNIFSGTVAPPPVDSRVPSWLRRTLLRGLNLNPDERFPSMQALLQALQADPAIARRKWVTIALVPALAIGAAAVATQFGGAPVRLCAGGAARLAGTWEGGGAPSPRKEQIHRAFLAAGKDGGERAFQGASRLLDEYVGRWLSMYSEACEATHARGEQSTEVLDLRMSCLRERQINIRALTDVFADADSTVVQNALAAAGSLPSLDRCADVAMLKAVIKPPEDPAKRAQATAIGEEVAKVNALGRAGRCDQANALGRGVLEAANKLGYLPLKAEIHHALGQMGETCTDPPAAIEHLEEAVLAAEACHHDEIAIMDSLYLSQQYADRTRDVRLSTLWVRHAEAILARFPHHPLLEAWMEGQKANVLLGQGRFKEALAGHQRALALWLAALGPQHVEIATGRMNVGLDLHELGRDVEAENELTSAINLYQTLLGPDNGHLALALLDQTEILLALGRFESARAAIERAISIWRGLGASDFFVGYGLLDRGRVELAEGKIQSARATLQQSSVLLRKFDGQVAAEADFALAGALWATPRDRPRALDLARGARRTIGTDTPGAAHKSTAIDGWLRAHQIL